MQDLEEVKFPRNTVITKPLLSHRDDSDEDTKCVWVNEKGDRIGEKCGKSTYDKAKYCAAHTTVDIRRKKTITRKLPLPEESSDSEEEEVITQDNVVNLNLTESNSTSDNEIVSVLKVIVTILAHIRLK